MALDTPDHEHSVTAQISLHLLAALVGIATLAVLGLRLVELMTGGQSGLSAYLITALTASFICAPFTLHFLVQRHKERMITSRLDALAATDEATGLLNRRAFLLRVNARLQYELTPQDKLCGGLLVIKTDPLHITNRATIAAARHRAMLETAKTLRQFRENGQYLAHFGQGEFVLFMPHADEACLHRIAVRIGMLMAKTTLSLGSENHSLSVSIGGALANHLSSFATLYRPASERCLAASQAGGNRALLEDPHSAPLAHTARRMAVKTRQAA